MTHFLERMFGRSKNKHSGPTKGEGVGRKPEGPQDKVHAFINYARQDESIANALNSELKRLGREDLQTFQDTRNIPPGAPWEPIILKELRKTDWLICVFTDKQSDYCGFEIATFKHFNGMLEGRMSEDKRLLCLYDCDPASLPSLFDSMHNVRVPTLEDVRSRKNLTFAELEDYWYDTPIGLFLREFCEYRNLYPVNEDSFRQDIAASAARITDAFIRANSSDVVEDTPCQYRIELTMAAPEEPLGCVPDSAVVTGTTQTFGLFGFALPQPMDTQQRAITWSEMKDKLRRDPRPDVPWMDKIESDIVTAASKLRLVSNDATLVGEDGRIYRPILGRHQLLMNGTRKFFVMFVETLKRDFDGDPTTSMLLASLVIASRFRFQYFEQWEAAHAAKFRDDCRLDEFADACLQLRYDLDRLDHESVQLGLGNVEAVVDAFGLENRARAERFFRDWFRIRTSLFDALPASRDGMRSERRGEMLAAAREFFEQARLQNSEFLELVVQTYSSRMLEDLEHERQLRSRQSPSATATSRSRAQAAGIIGG